jgi:hypothetical protein
MLPPPAQDRPALNGCAGLIVGFDEARVRYHVRLAEQTLALAPANLILPIGTRIAITGLASAAQWNGTMVTLPDLLPAPALLDITRGP